MTICNSCGSSHIKHEEKVGKGLPPKGYKNIGNRKITWKGIWDIYTCECGNIKRNLRK